jgi:hypothetical protein
MKLLTKNNPKTIKGEKYGYITHILYMSSFKYNDRGVNLCSHASPGCAESCLVGSGFGGMYPTVKKSRVEKANFFIRDRVGFLALLKLEIEKAIKSHKGQEKLVFRLNGTSDIPYEKFRVFDNGTKNIFELFPNVQFYDYTKNYLRFDKPLPKNYHLTFSRSENNGEKALELLERGVNVAMVFNKLPKVYKEYRVINGDESDLRFKDPKNRGTFKTGVIVGLKYKKMTGKGVDNKKAFESGFAITV